MLKGRVLAAVFFAAVASLSNLLQVSATDAAVTDTGHQDLLAEHELVATDASDNSAVTSLGNLLQGSATDAAVTESGHQNMVAEHELVATDASDNSVDVYSKRKLSKKTTYVK